MNPSQSSQAPTISTRSLRLWLVGLFGVLVGFGLVVGGGSVAFAGGVEGFGVVDTSSGVWYLRDPGSGDTTSFFYGNPGDFPMLGDWDCDGVDTPGLYRQSDGYVYLRNANTQGVADVRFFFGDPGDVPLAGDFDGDGCDTVSIYRPSESRVFVINELGSDDGGLGAADFSYLFGNPGDKPFVGDFDGDGVDTVGLHRESTGLVYFRNTHTQGIADAQFIYGDPGDKIMAGKWTSGHVSDTVGIFRPSQGMAYLKYVNTQGNADEEHLYGNRNMLPVAGHLGTLPGGSEPPPGNPKFVTAPVFLVGDSVMLGGESLLESTIAQATVDAKVSRNYGVADDIIDMWLNGHNPGVIVVHLGTNGAPSTSQLHDFMDAAGPNRRVLFLTVKQSNTANQATANARIAGFVPLYDNAELVDWYAVATAKFGDMSSIDPNYGAHLWSPAARKAYVDMIQDAILNP